MNVDATVHVEHGGLTRGTSRGLPGPVMYRLLNCSCFLCATVVAVFCRQNKRTRSVYFMHCVTAFLLFHGHRQSEAENDVYSMVYTTGESHRGVLEMTIWSLNQIRRNGMGLGYIRDSGRDCTLLGVTISDNPV